MNLLFLKIQKNNSDKNTMIKYLFFLREEKTTRNKDTKNLLI